MTKRKDHSVLFEVISRSREVQKPLPEPHGQEQKTEYARPEAIGKFVPPTAGPVVDKAGGVLTLSLTYSTCLLIAAGTIILLLGAFLLGRATVGTLSTDAAGRQEQSIDNRQAQMQPVSRQSGKYYLVIETLKRSSAPAEDTEILDEAKRIAGFCGAKGYPADVKYFDDKKYYIVWSGKAFDSAQSPEAQAYARDVQDRLGTEYFQKYRTYRFLQTTKTGEFNPRFLRQP